MSSVWRTDGEQDGKFSIFNPPDTWMNSTLRCVEYREGFLTTLPLEQEDLANDVRRQLSRREFGA